MFVRSKIDFADSFIIYSEIIVIWSNKNHQVWLSRFLVKVDCMFLGLKRVNVINYFNSLHSEPKNWDTAIHRINCISYSLADKYFSCFGMHFALKFHLKFQASFSSRSRFKEFTTNIYQELRKKIYCYPQAKNFVPVKSGCIQ